MATSLADMLHADYLSVDDGSLGFGNHVRVWRELAQLDCDWCLVVEDDAVPVRNFAAQLKAALNNAPSPLVSLYLGRDMRTTPRLLDAVTQAQANDASWIMHNKLLHAVAVAVRTPLIDNMLEYVERKRYLPIDDAISGWRARHLLKYPVAYTSPSLVEHRDTPSVIEHRRDNLPRNTPRTALHVGERSHWSNASVNV